MASTSTERHGLPSLLGAAHFRICLSDSVTFRTEMGGELKAPDASGRTPGSEIRLFFSYAHEDEGLRDKLATHLSTLKRTGWIREWHDRKITPGQSWADQIDRNLETADVVLLLISADFVTSDYCHEVEMRRALERHSRNEAKVVPVLLRPTDLEGLPFGKLQGLPTDLKPVTKWSDQDEAFLDIVKGLRKLITELRGPAVPGPLPVSETPQPHQRPNSYPASMDDTSQGAGRQAAISSDPGTAPRAGSPAALELDPSAAVHDWQIKLQRCLADALGNSALAPLVQDFVGRLRDDYPGLAQNADDIAAYLVHGSGDRHKRVAQFLAAAASQERNEADAEAMLKPLAFLLQTLVRKCRDENDRGLTRIPVKKKETVELVSLTRLTAPHIPRYGEDEREFKNGQRNSQLQNVGCFLPETGEWDVDAVCHAIARELLLSLGVPMDTLRATSDLLGLLGGKLAAYIVDPEKSPLHGVVVEQNAVHNPLQVDAVASRLRQTLGELFAVYVYGGQESPPAQAAADWLHTTEDHIDGLVSRYRREISPGRKQKIHHTPEASSMSNSGIHVGSVGPGANININTNTGTQTLSQVAQGKVRLTGEDTAELLQRLADLRALAQRSDDVGKQDYAALDQASETIAAEVGKPDGADRSVLTRAKLVLDRFKDIASIAGAIEKITTVLLPLLP